MVWFLEIWGCVNESVLEEKEHRAAFLFGHHIADGKEKGYQLEPFLLGRMTDDIRVPAQFLLAACLQRPISREALCYLAGNCELVIKLFPHGAYLLPYYSLPFHPGETNMGKHKVLSDDLLAVA